MATFAPTHTQTYRRLVAGTTINGTSLLSTDYLNHFNEIVMMLELAVDMPDMLGEIDGWQPKSYAQHFRDSGFSHKDLAIAAYDHAPTEYRVPFDRTVTEIERMAAEALDQAGALLSGSDAGEARHGVLALTRGLRALIERASAIVNGARLAELDPADDGCESTLDQAHIDALFA